ncbi:hypothetical protein SteCoe_33258 [Stentor coeruleus]|uniref:Uncharacterized protein n=1 Tax=Stentor coeruleus TaxID=5963 RepID=A0A1R2AX66_9CILI|nr:hypothetical protein SteCoe_33258 [Stentor coeruleus]
MQKPIFPSFRMPAYELPITSSCTFPIKLSNIPTRPNQNLSSLPKTNTVSVKNSLNILKDRPTSSSAGCQADFQEELIKQIEKEMLTEPMMQFLEVKDVEMDERPSQTPNGLYKFPNAHQNFLQVQEISLTTPFPIQNPKKNYIESDKKPLTPSEKSNASRKGKGKKVIVENKEKEKYDEQARDPIAELKETQDLKMKEARERLERLEEDALKLENEMKIQNDQLDRLNMKFTEENLQDRRALASRYIEKMTNSEPTVFDDEEDRVAKILSTNQQLYNRIEKALAPKSKPSEDLIQEFPEKQEILEASEALDVKRLPGQYTKINPIISKRITEAMNTAATAIQLSKQLNPKVIKKPIRY